MFKIGVYIFRRDLRLYDNTTLLECYKQNEIVIPIFIFSPKQVTNNEYKSIKSIQFMVECLEDLERNLKENNKSHKQPILFFYGDEIEIISQIHNKIRFQSLFVNQDYTPFSKKRDKKIASLCKKLNIEFHSFPDVCLFPPGTILTGAGTTYQKFTPFFETCMKNREKILKSNKQHFQNKSFIQHLDIQSKVFSLKNQINLQEAYVKFTVPSTENQMFGGRTDGLKKLANSSSQKRYNIERNDLSKETTQLSPYLKYGCLSIREVYEYFREKLGYNNDLIKQLIWRDFYIHLMDAFPHVLEGKSLKPKYDNIKWGNNREWFKKWCDGETGFPIVDACMKQLNESGYMHNRGRLIVSSFLIKILQIDWKWGEKYFAQNLIDYDPAANNGNWQWASGSGADSQPYFRIFNPWLQSEKHDKDAVYMKKWLPQLERANVPAKHLHQWDIYHKEYNLREIGYFKPIVDYSKMKESTLDMYKKII